MPALETFLVGRFMIFTLVLTRTSTLVMTAPIFGSQGVPRRVRALLAVVMSLLVTPVFVNSSIAPVANIADQLSQRAHLFMVQPARRLVEEQ